MDAAAKTVESLSQHILPEKPHHLSCDPLWRYRPRLNDASHPNGQPARFEEWHNHRLQYMTLVSQADRGTLLTRSYYDMREDPPKPPPREVGALAKSAGEKKKKLSLSDYKNKRTGTALFVSPPEPAISRHRETERPPAGLAAVASQPSTTSKPIVIDVKQASDSLRPTADLKKPDLARPPEMKSQPVDLRQRQHREGAAVDTRLPPKLPSLPPKPPSPLGKKRISDVEDEARAQKHQRPDDRRSMDRLPPQRDEMPRRKERPQPSSRDSASHRDDRPSSSSSLLNGRATTLKGASAAAPSTSSGARRRGESVNGVRSQAAAVGNRSAATKLDAPKPSVPPLLSPLHLSFDHDRPRAADGEASAKRDRKKRDEHGDGVSTGKLGKKSELPPQSRSNRVPPLLSPTLPPMVEAELRRRKKATPHSADDRPPDGTDGPGSRKKPVTGVTDEKNMSHKSLKVKFWIPKGLRQSVRRILALSSGRKPGPGHERERESEVDRAGSDEALQPPPARKRPVGSFDVPAEPLANKRRRMSDVARVAATPSTPSKKSTAMSRVSSSNSMAQTPGHAANVTSASMPRPNGVDGANAGTERQDVRPLADKENQLMAKGRSLKRDAELTLNTHRSSGATYLRGKSGELELKRAFAQSIESIVAFVMAFQMQNTWRLIQRKGCDAQTWRSILPLIEFFRKDMAARDDVFNSQPLYAVLLLLRAMCIDEAIKSYASVDNLASLNLHDIIELERMKARLWPEIRDANAGIATAALRVEANLWASLDDVTSSALRVVRTWASEEKVNWTPEPMLSDCWPITTGHT